MGDRRDADDFWDISRLVVTRPERAPMTFSPSAVPVHDEMPASQTAGGETSDCRLTLPHDGEEQAEEYVPRHSLLTRVRILRRPVGHNFYGQFRRTALRLFEEPGQACEYVPFFSYIPQYYQMSEEQTRYYLYWRGRVRAGEYLTCDYSYFWLLVYEILNLPDRVAPEEGMRLLCGLWCAYRKTLPQIERRMAQWVCDYALIYHLPPPTNLLAPILPYVLRAAELREFYLDTAAALTDEGIGQFLHLTCDYAYEQSRLMTEQNRGEVLAHFRAGMRRLLPRLLEGMQKGNGDTARRSDDAFCAALCACDVRYRIEVEYHPFERTEELRRRVTAALKYTENRLRALYSVKSRLTVQGLDDESRRLIDDYFDRILRERRARIERENAPAYERLYDPPTVGFSPTRAAEIEMLSWENTRRLVGEDASEQENAVSVPQSKDIAADAAPLPTVTPQRNNDSMAEPNTATGSNTAIDTNAIGSDAVASDAAAMSDADAAAEDAPPDEILCYLRGVRDGAAGAAAERLGMTQDALAERCNSFYAARIGDVVLEPDGAGGWQIVADYLEDLHL